METYDFKPHKKGDTFKGRKFIIEIYDPTTETTSPLDLTNASIRMQLRMNPTHPVKQELSTANGMMEITNPTGGEFIIKKQIIDFPPASYCYDMEITLADGTMTTYIGGVFPILQDVTR